MNFIPTQLLSIFTAKGSMVNNKCLRFGIQLR